MELNEFACQQGRAATRDPEYAGQWHTERHTNPSPYDWNPRINVRLVVLLDPDRRVVSNLQT